MVAACTTATFSLPNESYIYDALEVMHQAYVPVHNYVAVTVCTFGIFANILIITVLTRRQMQGGINTILSVIAICDGVVMLSYVIFIFHYRVVPGSQKYRMSCEAAASSFAWAVFTVIHLHIGNVFHTLSLFLTVEMAIIRYLTVRLLRNDFLQQFSSSVHKSLLICGLTFLLTLVLSAPVFLTFTVRPLRVTSCLDDNVTTYGPKISYYAEQNCIVVRALFWITGIVFKLLPCTLLLISIILLLSQLRNVNSNRRRLLSSNSARRQAPRDRTTAMLTVVLLVFLVTEMPQGVFAIGRALFDDNYKRHVYYAVGDVNDLLSLINSGINFIVYVSMSAAFRTQFRNLFVEPVLSEFNSSKRVSTTGTDLSKWLRRKTMLGTARIDDDDDDDNDSVKDDALKEVFV